MGIGILNAQTSGGAFRGEVRDASAAVVPGAAIQIRSTDTGGEIVTESNEDGLYVTPTLIPGLYELTAIRSGFSAELFGPVLLQVNQIVRVDFTLKVGATSDSIRVEASGAQPFTFHGIRRRFLRLSLRKVFAEIPLNGRKWEDLIRLSAGVNLERLLRRQDRLIPTISMVSARRRTYTWWMASPPRPRRREEATISIFRSTRSANFLSRQGRIRPNTGTLQEAWSMSSPNPGQTNGMAPLLSSCETTRWMPQISFSNSTRQPKNPLHYNLFGGSMGGPVRHDRTFFFLDYQGTITHAAAPMITTVPTDAQRRGDFSGLRDANGGLVPIYNPSGASVARTQFQNNIISPELIDPAAAKLSALFAGTPNQFSAKWPASFGQ